MRNPDPQRARPGNYLRHLPAAGGAAGGGYRSSPACSRRRYGNHPAGRKDVEESVRKLLKHLLEAGGYKVIEAADELHALHLFERHAGAIDLLLTDVIMPYLTAQLPKSRSKPRLKVIYMSGYTDDVLLQHRRAGTRGAIASCSKPWICFPRSSANSALDTPPVH